LPLLTATFAALITVNDQCVDCRRATIELLSDPHPSFHRPPTATCTYTRLPPVYAMFTYLCYLLTYLLCRQVRLNLRPNGFSQLYRRRSMEKA